jgi:hypothetical protein
MTTFQIHQVSEALYDHLPIGSLYEGGVVCEGFHDSETNLLLLVTRHDCKEEVDGYAAISSEQRREFDRGFKNIFGTAP